MSSIQWTIVVTVTITTIFELAWLYMAKSDRWLGIPLLIWMVLSLIYYAAVYAQYPIDRHDVGQSLRLLGYLTVLGLEGYRVYRVTHG